MTLAHPNVTANVLSPAVPLLLPPSPPAWNSSLLTSEQTVGGASTFGLSYIVNICLPGGLICVLLFFIFRLHDDHKLPSPFDVLAKLRAAWLVTDAQVTSLSGADACHYLIFLVRRRGRDVGRERERGRGGERERGGGVGEGEGEREREGGWVRGRLGRKRGWWRAYGVIRC